MLGKPTNRPQASRTSAHAMLAEDSIIRLSPEAYDAFARRLDEPARSIPELRALFAERLLFLPPEGGTRAQPDDADLK